MCLIAIYETVEQAEHKLKYLYGVLAVTSSLIHSHFDLHKWQALDKLAQHLLVLQPSGEIFLGCISSINNMKMSIKKIQ